MHLTCTVDVKLRYDSVISGFRHGVNEIIALLGRYAARVGSYQRFGTTY